MTPRLERAEYVGSYKIRVKFGNGVEGDVDLTDELWGEVFEPLKDQDLFQQFEVDQVLNTITWPTGADLAPEFLYDQATANPVVLRS